MLKPNESLQGEVSLEVNPPVAALKAPVKAPLDIPVSPRKSPIKAKTSPVSRKLYLPRKRKQGNQKQILYSILFVLVFIIGIVILLRRPPEQQGKVFSESYKRYYEKTKGKRP